MNSLTALTALKPLKPIKDKATVHKRLLSEIELILYTSNLCLFSMRILRDEIEVPNSDKVLNAVMNETSSLYWIMSQDNFEIEHNYTKKDVKKFFKDVGIKPKHLRT